MVNFNIFSSKCSDGKSINSFYGRNFSLVSEELRYVINDTISIGSLQVWWVGTLMVPNHGDHRGKEIPFGLGKATSFEEMENSTLVSTKLSVWCFFL